MNGSGERTSPREDSGLPTSEALRSEGGESILGRQSFQGDMFHGIFSESVLNGIPLGTPATSNAVNGHPSGSLTDALVQRELLSRAISFNEHPASVPINSFQVQQHGLASRAAAGLANANQFTNQLDLQPSFQQQQPMLGSMDLRQLTSQNLLLSMQHQLQMEQQSLQQQYRSNQALMASNNLPTASSWSSPHSTLAMMSQMGSQMNPSLVLQNQLLSNTSGLAALQQGPIHQNLLPFATARAHPIQGLGMRLQHSQTRQEASRGGTRESIFPMKLHRILADPRFHDCICWLPSGTSWRVLNQHVFANIVLPEFFKHQKYASFMRQVNGWGFKRTVQGPDINSYSHELFVRGNPELCLKMRRLKLKKKSEQEAEEES